MEFRKALPQDLPALTRAYQGIVSAMNDSGIRIWNDLYPSALFPEDIAAGKIYLLADERGILAAFALNVSSRGENDVRWESEGARALYINYFAVNAEFGRSGIGGIAIHRAAELARDRGAEVLRLFVVDCNAPAIAFYEKNGFRRAAGEFSDSIHGGPVLREYPYELRLAR